MSDKRWTVWLKAIGVAVVVVLLVKAFFVTSCFIPSSGMENSLYQGEGVLVNKWSYGLRLPFPSLFGYHRVASGNVEKGDIILFNNPMPRDAETRLENREFFISRCVGTAGDTLMLNQDWVCVDGEVFSPDSKELYVYPSDKEDEVLSVLDQLGLKGNALVGYTPDGGYIRSFSHYEFYLLSQKARSSLTFTPLNSRTSRKVHPFIVPAKGKRIDVYPWNKVLLCNTILCHEHKQAEIVRDTLWVEGDPVDSYTFTKDYYWVVSNDPVNLADSRLFGFVPEDHIIGKVWRVWFTSHKGRFFQRVQ